MHKSNIRALRKQLQQVKQQAALYEMKANGRSKFVRAHMLAKAEEQQRLAHAISQKLSTKA